MQELTWILSTFRGGENFIFGFIEDFALSMKNHVVAPDCSTFLGGGGRRRAVFLSQLYGLSLIVRGKILYDDEGLWIYKKVVDKHIFCTIHNF